MEMTAVEWLAEELTLPELGKNPQWVQDAIEQAKEMEKEQIINAVKCYTVQWIDAEQYYNETFKTKQND
jgi:hypothetical protein